MDVIEQLKETSKEIRKLILHMIGKLGSGHIGGSMSIVEVLTVLYFNVMNIDPQNPKKSDRDRFVLSKGHAGPALYATLALKGYFDMEELDTLNKPNTNLPSHCDMNKTVGVDMTAGSLGQGISAAVGMAIAAKMDKNMCNIFALIGDGESQEGQVWEAAMLAGHKKLNNLIAFLDYNDMQIDGYVHDINDISPVEKKWDAFNWFVQCVNGHDVEEILAATQKAKMEKEKPSMIILKTVKGKGVCFAEGQVGCHHMTVSEEQCNDAIKALQ